MVSEENILSRLLSRKKYPSLYFALEFILFSFLLPPFLPQIPLKLNAFLTGNDQEISEKAESAKRFPAIKIKTGNRSPDEFLTLIQKSGLSHIPLRIDCNRSWSLQEALYFCDRFPYEDCAYLEEPLKNPDELPLLARKMPHPIAFDESLSDRPLEFLLSVPTKKAFVVKPTLHGSFRSLFRLYRTALQEKMLFVITSAYESGLGHLMIAKTAQLLGIEEPIGLDTYSLIKEDILINPPEITDGYLKKIPFPFDPSLLHENLSQRKYV